MPKLNFPDQHMRTLVNVARFAALILVIGLLFNAAEILDLDSLFSREGLAQLVAMMRDWGQTWGILGYILTVGFATFSVLINIPTVIVLAAIAIVYDPLTTFILGVVYWAFACCFIYLIGHNLGKNTVSSMLEALPQKAHQLLTLNGVRTILYMRLMMFAFPPTNWVLATLPVTLREYVQTSVLGGIPHIIVWSTLGPRVINDFIERQAGWWHSPEILFISSYGLILPFIVGYFLPNQQPNCEDTSQLK